VESRRVAASTSFPSLPRHGPKCATIPTHLSIGSSRASTEVVKLTLQLLHLVRVGWNRARQCYRRVMLVMAALSWKVEDLLRFIIPPMPVQLCIGEEVSIICPTFSMRFAWLVLIRTGLSFRFADQRQCTKMVSTLTHNTYQQMINITQKYIASSYCSQLCTMERSIKCPWG